MTRETIENCTQSSYSQTKSNKVTYNRVRKLVRDKLFDALQEETDSLIKAPPASGKSRGVFKALRRSGVPAIYLSPRQDLDEQAMRWCEKEELRDHVLPSFPEDCPAYEHERIKRLYHRGATPSEIHERDLCPGDCRYEQRLPTKTSSSNGEQSYVPQEEADVLIGHPRHAHVPHFVNGRVVIYDDVSTDMYINHPEEPFEKISIILEDDDFPFSTVDELLRKRNGEKQEDALKQLSLIDLDIWEDEGAHAHTKRIVETLLLAEDLGNGVRCYQGIQYTGVVDERLNVHLLESPSLSAAKAVIALDAYPMLFGDDNRPLWWQTRLGIDPEVIIPLNREETQKYISETLGVKVIQTTKFVKPYSSGYAKHIATGKDRKLINFISEQHQGRDITVITPDKAISVLDSESLPVKKWVNFAGVQSSNEYGNEDVGVIIGSTHYGNSFLKQIGAFMQERIESNGEKGPEKSYGMLGDEILRNMREYQVAQAILRFGRDENVDEATVYVHTAAIPEEIPISKYDPSFLSAELQILDFLQSTEPFLGLATVKNISKHVPCGERRVRQILKKLKTAGEVEVYRECNGPTPRLWTSSDDERVI